MSKFQLMETTISAVHAAMLAGEVTCRELVQAYLARIEAYENKGPAINAIILVNPKALEEADRLDAALKETGKLTGPPPRARPPWRALCRTTTPSSPRACAAPAR